MTPIKLALDVGGTKLAACQVLPGGIISNKEVVLTGEDNWAECDALLRKVAGDAQVGIVGISSAGPIDFDSGMVMPVNTLGWADGFPLVAKVQAIFPDADIRLIGDGVAAALGEFSHGAGKEANNFLGAIVSTGVGAGIVSRGKSMRGRTGNAGHIGHTPVHGITTVCGCGGIGCLETVASGPGAVRWAKEQGWQGENGIELAKDPGEIATRALERAGIALGEAFTSAAALLDLDLVAVGGGFANAGPRLWDPMIESAKKHQKLRFIRDLKIVPAQLGSDASLAGAAVLADQDDYTR
jgi:glucokinase